VQHHVHAAEFAARKAAVEIVRVERVTQLRGQEFSNRRQVIDRVIWSMRRRSAVQVAADHAAAPVTPPSRGAPSWK
jgi:hypothetical protein